MSTRGWNPGICSLTFFKAGVQRVWACVRESSLLPDKQLPSGFFVVIVAVCFGFGNTPVCGQTILLALITQGWLEG